MLNDPTGKYIRKWVPELANVDAPKDSGPCRRQKRRSGFLARDLPEYTIITAVVSQPSARRAIWPHRLTHIMEVRSVAIPKSITREVK